MSELAFSNIEEVIIYLWKTGTHRDEIMRGGWAVTVPLS
jgi:hypothetical protein